ncbi:ADP-ribosyltransferase [Staphylococcus hyicus]|uniref:ADP-ribosyltransferase n=1 Tax=Staphylococcus hyicus TaxID=1284 RepID=A0ACD5FMZ9_STAHY|nr:ADP-ribosyltransferase [Staphylococcus hyicus]AJC95801.1 epidermal cell differentiation inhibitor [Staphylococcus hyicus]MDP4462592.1 ADP-ribosyltransferase [Staphylococcus hyicus]RTX65731.1 Epidermal cell differentiation inhibitor [Staphylococcus hyicus]SQE47299.1 epidermal cell differentiation inhibitor [Staphylococcus hyicus]
MKTSYFSKILLTSSIVLTSIGLVEQSIPLSSNVVFASETKEFTNLNEATEWGNKLIKEANYSSSDKTAIYEYTKNSSVLNEPLRNSNGLIDNLSPTLQDKIRKLDSVINKTSTPEQIIVHRLLNLDYLTSIDGFTDEDFHNLQNTNDGKYDKQIVNKLHNMMNSKIYRENGYSSTQLVKGAALAGRPIELKIELPKGTKAAYIDSKDLTAYPGQQELLLPRGTEYAINKVYLSDDEKRIIIEAIAFKK